MGSRYQLTLATESDDAALRQILAQTPMAGGISLSFRRDPAYFKATCVEGRFYQCIVAKDRQTGLPVACGSRSIRTRYVNGVPAPIGYLAGLRILPAHRKGVLLAQVYRYRQSNIVSVNAKYLQKQVQPVSSILR